MEAFQYCPLKNCAIEKDVSTIASDNSFDRGFAKYECIDNLIKVLHKIEFDLTLQVSVYVCTDICGILRDVNGDFGSIRSNLLDATLVTS